MTGINVEEIFKQYYKNKFGEAMPGAKGAWFDEALPKGFKHYESISKKCCERKSLINDNGEVVCVFCGQVSHYEMVNDGFIDFRKSPYQVSRKSKYQRKYHMNNVLQDKLLQNYIDLTTEEMSEFIRIFKRIVTLFFRLYPLRKRLIKFNFLFYKIFSEAMPASDASKIFSVRLSKQTAKKYNEIWIKIKVRL